MVKLDRTNYFAWKAQVLTHLRGNELLRFIETAISDDDTVAIQQDQLLLGWIFSTLTPSVLPQVTPYSTSFTVWSALTGIFNAKSKTRILQVKNRLTNYKKEHQSVDEYLAELTWLVEEVCEVGVALDDGELILIALNGLDLSYEAFVTAQSARADEVSFAAFQGMLRAHEERFGRSPAPGMIPMANIVSNDTVTCQICLKKEHLAIACFNRHDKSRF